MDLIAKIITTAITTFITIVITGILKPVIMPIATKIAEGIEQRLNRKPNLILPPHSSKPRKTLLKRKLSLILILLSIIAGGLISHYLVIPKILIHSFELSDSQTIEPTLSSTPPPATTPTSTPTPIARGDLTLEINFSSPNDGLCNDYNSSVLGYSNKEYYIVPKFNGYIAVCHADDNLPATGSLQVTAHPEATVMPNAYYGFGALFGWHGGGLSTSDACIFGVRREFGETQAVFIEISEGRQHTHIASIPNLTIDNNPHTLRFVLLPDGTAQGYVDERFVADYVFSNCQPGPIGMVAWGTGDFKVYFDDLKFFSLPPNLEGTLTLMQ